MSGVRIERQGALAVLRLDKARGNAIDEPLVEDLARRGGRGRRRRRACGGCSWPPPTRSCSAPASTSWPSSSTTGRPMERFMTRFEAATLALYGLRKPVVAAVSGRRRRRGLHPRPHRRPPRPRAQGSPIGLNEVRVGVPLPWWWRVCSARPSPRRRSHRVALLGRNFTDDGGAARSGLVHEVRRGRGLRGGVPRAARGVRGAATPSPSARRRPGCATGGARRDAGGRGRASVRSSSTPGSPGGTQEKIRETVAARRGLSRRTGH